MKEIIDQLKKIKNKIEGMDDPTAPEEDRDKLGYAYYFVERCIEEIEEL